METEKIETREEAEEATTITIRIIIAIGTLEIKITEITGKIKIISFMTNQENSTKRRESKERGKKMMKGSIVDQKKLNLDIQ